MERYFLLNKFKKFVVNHLLFEKIISNGKKHISGYTLIEMLVSISIVFILSGALLAYNHQTEEQVILFKDQSILVGVINRAKALSQQRLNAQDVCAFGVHILSDKGFLIFGDKKTDSKIPCIDDGGNYTTDFMYDSGEEIILYPNGRTQKEIFSLDKSLKFSSVVIGKDIVFIPPDVFVTSTVPLPMTIEIKNIDGSKSAITKIYSGGQIVVK